MLLLVTGTIRTRSGQSLGAPIRKLFFPHAVVRVYSSTNPRLAGQPDPKERYHRTVTLPDGRVLAWAEAGSPTGFPFFMFHGFPGSRMEARGLEDIGHRHNLRVICPERPGYGLSTFQPGRRLLDWPADVQFLARHLEMERYSILGGSGGGPYACM
jgi:pimeloyl-ACP methyl ester carboxylesterase